MEVSFEEEGSSSDSEAEGQSLPISHSPKSTSASKKVTPKKATPKKVTPKKVTLKSPVKKKPRKPYTRKLFFIHLVFRLKFQFVRYYLHFTNFRKLFFHHRFEEKQSCASRLSEGTNGATETTNYCGHKLCYFV